MNHHTMHLPHKIIFFHRCVLMGVKNVGETFTSGLYTTSMDVFLGIIVHFFIYYMLIFFSSDFFFAIDFYDQFCFLECNPFVLTLTLWVGVCMAFEEINVELTANWVNCTCMKT